MLRLRVCLLLWAVAANTAGATQVVDALLSEAIAAEARLDSRRALELLLEAERARPDDAFILRRIARQYSDLTVDLPDGESRKEAVERALDYSQRAVTLDPANPEGVLSLAVCYGKLALYSGTREKVELSRLVRLKTERALALDSDYSWAHHLLGRWHYEVSELGSVARFVVRLIYGGLPDASTADAVRHLERAVQLAPDQLQHRLELGFAYLAHGEREMARAAFEAGLAMPSREKHDEPAKQRAREALARL
jgi:tetratricopeptide (TPR) repeat protein